MESTSGSNSSNDGAPLLNNDDDATTNTTMPLRALVYTPAGSNGSSRCATLSVLDQLLLPHTVTFLPIDNVQAAWTVIRTMQVRGAPLIALTAVLGLAVHLQRHGATECTDGDVGGDETHSSSSRNIIQSYLHSKLDYLATSRPTAVNLFHALSEIRTTVQATLDIAASAASSSCLSLEAMRDSVVQAVVLRAQAMLAQDVADCQALAECGAQELLDRATAATTNNQKKNLTLMTICNTGSLATAGCGTALGVIRTLHERHARLHRVITLETRPYNQGSRLTALECQMHALPNPLLICDSMAAAYMNTNTNNSNMNENAVFACVVGADRVAANGDTANKIGTYQLAVGAAAHGVPFYVAAPTTTLDGATASGSDILIEERPPAELRESSQAPDTMPVWNPA